MQQYQTTDPDREHTAHTHTQSRRVQPTHSTAAVTAQLTQRLYHTESLLEHQRRELRRLHNELAELKSWVIDQNKLRR